MAWQEGAVPPTISEDTVWGVCGRLTKTGVQERAGWTLNASFYPRDGEA